jgi:hypothetical protein
MVLLISYFFKTLHKILFCLGPFCHKDVKLHFNQHAQVKWTSRQILSNIN